MRFSEHLGSHLTPEWRSQYVQYDEMKNILYMAVDKAPLTDDPNDPKLKLHYSIYDDDFLAYCEKELAKVNTFFAEKLAEAVRRFGELKHQFGLDDPVHFDVIEVASEANQAFENEETKDNNENRGDKKPRKPLKYTVSNKKLKEMKFAVSEFYLSLVLIQNFQQLNFTAFRKILKKHDKLWKTTSGVELRVNRVETSPFYTNKKVEQLILDTETIAIDELEGGERGKAMKRLRVPPLSERQSHLPSFMWGLFSGFFVILVIVLAIAAAIKGPELDWEPAVRMYRGMLIVFLMIGFLGINVHGWGRAGVNHVLIFEIDPRNHLTYVQLLMFASMFLVMWCLSCIAFLFSKDAGLSMFANPLALALFTLAYLLNPTRTFHYRARRWLLRILFRIVTAPYYPVRFADFWLADQLNSLVVPLLDFQYIACFYIHAWKRPVSNEPICTDPKNVIRPIIALLPAWFRFAQCLRRYRDTRKAFPHLVNAGKYFTGMVVTILSTIYSVTKPEGSKDTSNPLFYVWLCSLILGTFYTLTWDLKMDWGLFSKDAGENRFLREQIVYDYKIYYYLAIVFDVIFRFLWTLTLSVGNANLIHHEFFLLFIAIGEVMRRFVWNFFRLENEHLNNVGEFRAVRDISIKPILPKNENDKTQNGGKKQLEKYDPDIAEENDIVIVCSRSSEERPKI